MSVRSPLITRVWLLLASSLLLASCAARAPLPQSTPALELPQQLLIQQRGAQTDSDSLLVIQEDAGALRFSLLDPLGVPLARQRLVNGEWHSEGLLPPNPQARELFAALLFALTPDAQLTRFYPDSRADAGSRSLPQGGQPRWEVRRDEPPALSIRLQDGTRYRVTPLPSETSQ